MAISISIKNLHSGNLSIDAKFDEDRALRENLALGETKAISGFQLDELDANDEIQALISDGKLELVLVDGPLVVRRFSFVASAPADVPLDSSIDHKMQLLDTMMIVGTAGTGTLTLHDAAAAGGNALSSAMLVTSTGRIADASIVSSELAAGSALFANRTNTDAAGELVLTLQRLS
jgi:hypothetical protein